MGGGGSKVIPKSDAARSVNAAEPAGTMPPTNISHYKGGKLGVIRLDYDYEAAPGDIDCWKSYDYEVVYKCVPGLTFDVCQSGRIPDPVKEELRQSVSFLVKQGVHGITGDCGFMMYLQDIVRDLPDTRVPVFMSALAQLPAVECAYGKGEKIAIFTANGQTLEPMRELIRSECGGLDTNEEKFVIVGCESVPGFEAVERGEKVDVEKVTPGMVAKAKQVLEEHPDIRAFLMECTELPPYSDAVRHETKLPVYDAITACNFFMSGVQDNPRFGLNGFQKVFDGTENTYRFGANLNKRQRSMLKTKTKTQQLRIDQ